MIRLDKIALVFLTFNINMIFSESYCSGFPISIRYGDKVSFLNNIQEGDPAITGSLKSISKLPHYRIAIEGLPGSGKTSLLFSLIEKMGQDTLILSELNPEPSDSWIEQDEDDKGSFYHKLWVERMAIIENFKKSIKGVFFDRSFFSNLAFSYAFDRFYNTKSYNYQKMLFENELSHYKIDLIIILLVSSQESINRRKIQRYSLAPHLKSKEFLENLHFFYSKLLPSLSNSPILFLDTDCLEQEKILNLIETLVDINSNQSEKNKVNNIELKKKFLELGRKYKLLDEGCSSIINFLGYPTMYFGKHCLQFDKDQFFFLNNNRLNKILSERLSVD